VQDVVQNMPKDQVQAAVQKMFSERKG
jgi:hypothetical protein